MTAPAPRRLTGRAVLLGASALTGAALAAIVGFPLMQADLREAAAARTAAAAIRADSAPAARQGGGTLTAQTRALRAQLPTGSDPGLADLRRAVEALGVGWVSGDATTGPGLDIPVGAETRHLAEHDLHLTLTATPEQLRALVDALTRQPRLLRVDALATEGNGQGNTALTVRTYSWQKGP